MAESTGIVQLTGEAQGNLMNKYLKEGFKKVCWALPVVSKRPGGQSEIQEVLSDHHTTLRVTEDWNKFP